jgi:hypothetical protein
MFTLIMPGSETIGDQLVRWVAPFTGLVGLGLLIGLVTRRSNYGALLIILLDGAMLFGGAEALMSRFPFAWVFHLFLSPYAVTPTDYVINRLVLIGLGLGFIAYALWVIRDEEKLLRAAISG